MAHAGTKPGPVTQPRTYKLRIFEDDNGQFKVRSGSLDVEIGDTLEWESKDTAATVMFPIINGVDVVSPNPIYVGIGKKKRAVVVLDLTAVPRTIFDDVEVPYQVYCEKNNSYAEGNSDPKIIVKGP